MRDLHNSVLQTTQSLCCSGVGGAKWKAGATGDVNKQAFGQQNGIGTGTRNDWKGNDWKGNDWKGNDWKGNDTGIQCIREGDPGLNDNM